MRGSAKLQAPPPSQRAGVRRVHALSLAGNADRLLGEDLGVELGHAVVGGRSGGSHGH